MEEQEKQQETSMQDKVICKVEELIDCILTDDMQPDAIKCLGELVDIHKDLKNEKYWEIKEEYYMYRDYNDYNDYNAEYGRRSRDSRGRYRDGGSYNRRGVPGSGRSRYRGEDMLDEMSYSYGAYSESNEYGDSYGASAKELEKMLDCNIALIEHLKKNAKSQEEMQIIEKKVKEMSML